MGIKTVNQALCSLDTHKRVSIRPAEVSLNGSVVQTDPLVLFILIWRREERVS